jgi:hypothetical protein
MIVDSVEGYLRRLGCLNAGKRSELNRRICRLLSSMEERLAIPDEGSR